MIKRYWCSPEGVMLECGPADEPCANDYVLYTEYAKLQVEVELLRAATVAPRIAPATRPFERGDAVKLKRPQAITLMGQSTGTNIGSGERGVFISDGHNINGRQTAVIELSDHPYREWRIIVELSNLERV